MSGNKRLAIAAVGLIALLTMVGLSGAATNPYTADFGSFALGTVNGQDGWHSAAPGDVPALPNGYDQAVVANGGGAPAAFGAQSLRMSNAYTNGEFFYQTYSPSIDNPAGESEPNQVFDGSFQFTSTSVNQQPGLALSVSPDNGFGARMSYVRLEDAATGIQVFFDDVSPDGSFNEYDLGIYSRSVAHTVRFLIQTVPGPSNDILRLYIDGVDQGDRLHKCFTTWEQYYRVGEGHEPGVINSFEFRAGGTAVPALAGGGYLYDNVSVAARNTGGPAPTACGPVHAFCSPGYWKNASDSAWALVAPITKNSSFNTVVVPNFYANAINPAGTTLWQVITAKGANTYGKAAGPLGLNPSNAVGAALTAVLPGNYVVDPNAACPIDNHGNVIPPL